MAQSTHAQALEDLGHVTESVLIGAVGDNLGVRLFRVFEIFRVFEVFKVFRVFRVFKVFGHLGFRI